MMTFNKEFRQAHPETIGETDSAFDMANYAEWLEQQLVNKNDLLQCVSTRFSDAVSDINSIGLECGIEDVGITCRYQAMEYGFEQCKERALEAIKDLVGEVEKLNMQNVNKSVGTFDRKNLLIAYEKHGLGEQWSSYEEQIIGNINDFLSNL